MNMRSQLTVALLSLIAMGAFILSSTSTGATDSSLHQDPCACTCGDEFCDDGLLQRCMSSSGDKCCWVPTNEVC